VAALNGIVGAHLDWSESKGLNGWERKALELAEERSQLGEPLGLRLCRAVLRVDPVSTEKVTESRLRNWHR
jgi:hypothetical protein